MLALQISFEFLNIIWQFFLEEKWLEKNTKERKIVLTKN